MVPCRRVSGRPLPPAWYAPARRTKPGLSSEKAVTEMVLVCIIIRRFLVLTHNLRNVTVVNRATPPPMRMVIILWTPADIDAAVLIARV